MRKHLRANSGIRALLRMYRGMFRTPENLNYYSEEDYKTAERKFLKHALEQRRIELDEERLRE